MSPASGSTAIAPEIPVLAHRPDFGQRLHGRAVKQPLLAVESFRGELARAGMGQLERRGRDRFERLLGKPGGALDRPGDPCPSREIPLPEHDGA